MLTGEPGEKYVVSNDRPEDGQTKLKATADNDGVLRNRDGKSLSEGAYSIMYQLPEVESEQTEQGHEVTIRREIYRKQKFLVKEGEVDELIEHLEGL